MFAHVHCPDALLPEELDAYLEQGWFRMGQTIFTTNFLMFKEQFYSAVWLRVTLQQLQADRTQQRLFRQNSIFRTEICEAQITPAKEELYKIYKQGITFDASASLHDLLLGNHERSVYATHEVNVYDGDQLIATGFFDMGHTSAAGITSFFNHTYKKYSLGKYLIYLKIEYCRNKGLQFFYPGYFVPGYPSFDYKLEIGKSALQFFQFTTQKWLMINEFSFDRTPIQLMRHKLGTLQSLLAEAKINSNLLYYEFFSANSVPDLMGAGFFDFPLFLNLPNTQEDAIGPMVAYEVTDQQYHVILCDSAWSSDVPARNNGIYSSHLLREKHHLFSSPAATDIVAVLLQEMNFSRKAAESQT
jgi:leucyl-tRNA---protein transferase